MNNNFLMPDEAYRKDIFAWYGAASYYAQCVEVEMWIARLFLARTERDNRTDQEWEELENKKLTMGCLLNIIKGKIKLTDYENEVLDNCCKLRNWLNHHYWEQRCDQLSSIDSCRRAIDELTELCGYFKICDSIAQKISARVRKSIGISEKIVRKIQKEYIQRLMSGESSEEILNSIEDRLIKFGNGF